MSSEPDDKTPLSRFGLEDDKDTAFVPKRKRRMLQQSRIPEDASNTLRKGRELLLVVRGMVERLELPEDGTVVLGRADLNARVHPDVDLTPYGALDRGVSRRHASLHVQDDRLYVTDLESTNGTFLNDVRLEPHKPAPLRKGSELLLGRLAVTILFR